MEVQYMFLDIKTFKTPETSDHIVCPPKTRFSTFNIFDPTGVFNIIPFLTMIY